MTSEEVKQVVEAVIANKQVASYWYIIIMVIISGACAYFGAYLSTKGKNLATKEDIGKITNEVESIKADYARDLEKYKRELENRAKAEKVAELFARAFYKEPDLREFNRLNWELSLYLPKEIVCEISQKLIKTRTPAKAMEILIMVREHFGMTDGLQWENIMYSMPDGKTEPVAGGTNTPPLR